MFVDHVPHIPTAEELAAAPTADATQTHDWFEAQHPDLDEGLYRLAERSAAWVAG